MNPLRQWVLVNALGFIILLATLANETHKVYDVWVSVVGYNFCAIVFGYSFFVVLPRLKKWLDAKVDSALPGGDKK